MSCRWVTVDCALIARALDFGLCHHADGFDNKGFAAVSVPQPTSRMEGDRRAARGLSAEPTRPMRILKSDVDLTMQSSVPSDLTAPARVNRAGSWLHRLLVIALPMLDSAALIGGFALAYVIYRHYPFTPLEVMPPPLVTNLRTVIPTMALHVLTLLTVFFFARLYHQRRALSRIDQSTAIVAATSVGVTMTSGFATFFLKNSLFDIDYPRQLVLYVWGVSLFTVLIGREMHRQLTTRLRTAGYARDRVLIIGSGDIAHAIAAQIQSRPELGYEIVGTVNSMVNNAVDQQMAGVPIIGHPDQLPALIDNYAIDEVIIALPDASHKELVSLIGSCQRGRVSIKVYPDVFAYMAGSMSIDELGNMPLLSVRDMPMRGWTLTFKRGLDIFGSIIGLIVLSPLILLTAILIKLDSAGPVWFCQERTGLDGRPFPMIKFRTMRTDSEAHGPGWTIKNDPRVTRFGRWMRHSNWDEIPQLINVLLGQMSLVGPRPEQKSFVEEFREYIPRYMERHREKAGMTGWAQVNGYRGDTSIVERTKYDLYYVENWSVWFDIKIIIRTIVQTLRRTNKNAY